MSIADRRPLCECPDAEEPHPAVRLVTAVRRGGLELARLEPPEAMCLNYFRVSSIAAGAMGTNLVSLPIDQDGPAPGEHVAPAVACGTGEGN